MIYEKALDENQKLEMQIRSIQNQLKKFPEGKLISASNGKGNKWYWSDGHKPVYLPKTERSLAEQLAHKKYLTLRLKNLLQEKKAIGFYLRHHDDKANQKEQSYINSPEYKELLAPAFIPMNQELADWENAPYETNEQYTENLIHNTYSGKLVRSKSEAIIDMFLYKNKIPFRYECKLQLGEAYVFPDFTIRHPRTGETFYWEHFGMMDNPSYVQKACSKIQLYASNGIIPSVQLITTYETKANPLSSQMVEKIVEYYFL